MRAKRPSHSVIHPAQLILTVLGTFLLFFILAKWSPVSAIVHNIQSQLYNIGITMNKTFVHIFKSSESLEEQVKYYQELIAGYTQDRAYTNQLEVRIEQLEHLLGYAQSVEYNTIPARILSRSISNEHTIFIDQGSKNGVKVGLPVVIQDGFLIGTINHVNEYTSTILLLEDPQSRIPVRLIDQDQTGGLLVGEGGYLLRLLYIPQDRLLNIGDPILTAPMHERMASDLVIGVIAEIIKDETAPFQEALIEPIYSSTHYTSVLIVDTTSVNIYEE